MKITIKPITPEHIPGFRDALGVVIAERQYLLTTKIPDLEVLQKFVRDLSEEGGAQFVAFDETSETVVGWCDVTPQKFEGVRHVGGLGMGITPEYRGQGIGSRLLEATIDASFKNRILRIELDAFRSNERAIRLYEKFGFQHEGIKRKARYIDGKWDDRVMMALLKPGM